MQIRTTLLFVEVIENQKTIPFEVTVEYITLRCKLFHNNKKGLLVKEEIRKIRARIASTPNKTERP
jgi:hypothetical protein